MIGNNKRKETRKIASLKHRLSYFLKSTTKLFLSLYEFAAILKESVSISSSYCSAFPVRLSFRENHVFNGFYLLLCFVQSIRSEYLLMFHCIHDAKHLST